MRLTTQIREYKMDPVILDLGFDANVLPKQTWRRMGRLALVVSNPVKDGKSTSNYPDGEAERGDS